MNSAAWTLHTQLERDTLSVGDLALSRVLVTKDANYPWLVLVPRRPDLAEIIDLADSEQMQLMTEMSQTARALKQITQCDKLNVAALGNAVPQLHVHVIARRKTDAAWPKPVWGQAPALDYASGELDRFVTALRKILPVAA